MEVRLKDQLPDFLEVLDTPAPVSLHFNPIKSNKPENFDGVKWYANGVYLEERPVFTLDPLFHAGQYYVQEASSMFLAEAVRQTVDLSKPLRVLDLAAAPGGKSTLLASLLHPESFILCNEVIKSRFRILDYNLSKWGMPNTNISNHDSKDFKHLEGLFDVILLDAPCSGEGLFRKDPGAVDHWDTEHVKFCSLRQRRILGNTVKLLRPGGTLIYSTCTYNGPENEENAQWLQESYALENIPLKTPSDWSIEERTIGYQFYPHRVKGEGFYLASFRKTSGKEAKIKTGNAVKKFDLTAKEKSIIAPWLKTPEDLVLMENKNGQIRAILKPHLDIHLQIAKTLIRYEPGTIIGSLKRDTFIPSAELALSTLVSDEISQVELSLEQSLRYLKKEDPKLEEIPAGWALVKYQGLPMGWVKGLKNRINNYYPKEWRIRMKID